MSAETTPRELRLRAKIDELRDRISELEEVRGHCVYCGGPASGFVCHAHSDLRALDPMLRKENAKLRARLKDTQKSREKWKGLALGYERTIGVRGAV